MALGLITEYNPFHYGHLHHLNKSKKITNNKDTIVVMSGNFTQRGEPAIYDKYLRTNMALQNGVDMVIELPTLYSTSSAEFFARETINILNKCGIVDSVCFGSECGNISELKKISSFFVEEKKGMNPDYKNVLNKYLKEGINYPTARNRAYEYFFGNNEILSSPNNILGIEYLKALEEQNSSINPFTINRIKSDYNSTEIEGIITSATSIRNSLHKNNISELKKCMPNANLINNVTFSDYNKLSTVFHYIVHNLESNELGNILDITEGLENRIVNIANETFLLSNIINKVKTKRFTLTKIQRAILHIILNIQKSTFEYYNQLGGTPYVRVLGFNKEKQYLLKQLTQKSELPVITNLKNAKNILNNDAYNLLCSEIKYTDIYNLTVNKYKKNYELSQSLVINKKSL